MIISAALAQMTPKAIGWLTDDILSKDSISFEKVIPFLVFILVVNVFNEFVLLGASFGGSILSLLELKKEQEA